MSPRSDQSYAGRIEQPFQLVIRSPGRSSVEEISNIKLVRSTLTFQLSQDFSAEQGYVQFKNTMLTLLTVIN